MRSFFIVQLNPRVQIALKFFECFVDLFTKRDSVELIEHRLVKTLTDPIGLGTLGLGPGVVDVFHRQVQLIFMAVAPAVLRPPIGQHSG